MEILTLKANTTTVSLIEYPDAHVWEEVRRRAMITVHRDEAETPTDAWIRDILRARHSPIRYARYCYLMKGIPSNISTHFARHIHAEKYISTLRNDRQRYVDGDTAPRNTPVDMIMDCNAEELMVIANKRLCRLASRYTQDVTRAMCDLASAVTPQIRDLLVPMCEYHGGVCHEMRGCGKCVKG